MAKTSPVPKAEKGRARSLAARKQGAAVYDRLLWDWLFIIALLYQPKTLEGFVEALNSEGIPTRRGGRWSAGLVHAYLQGHGVSAQELVRRVTEPPAREWPDYPQVAYAQVRAALDKIDTPSEEVGCLSSTGRRSEQD